MVLAHRAAFVLFFGPEALPRGSTLDHRCRRPECVNPLHLRPCSRSINTALGNGHRARTWQDALPPWVDPWDVLEWTRP